MTARDVKYLLYTIIESPAMLLPLAQVYSGPVHTYSQKQGETLNALS